MMPKRVIDHREPEPLASCEEPGCPGVEQLLLTETMVVRRCAVSGRLLEAFQVIDEPRPWWSR